MVNNAYLMNRDLYLSKIIIFYSLPGMNEWMNEWMNEKYYDCNKWMWLYATFVKIQGKLIWGSLHRIIRS